MKKEKFKLSSICLKFGLFLFLAVLMLPVTQVKADDTISVKNKFKETVIYSKEDEKYGYIFSMSDLYGGSLDQVKIKSSNKSVAIVKPISGGVFQLHPKKAGTTRITVTAVRNGRKVKKTGTVKVVSFQNPFKVLKAGGKNCLSKMKGSHNYVLMKTKKSKIKLNYKVGSSWKLVDSNAYGTEEISSMNMRYVKAKNKMSYSIEKGETLILSFELRNKKNGVRVFTSLYIER